MSPDISIIMAAHNGGQYLSEQIKSILGQSCKEWQLIIRDDGSCDSTPEVIHEYSQRYPENIRSVTDSDGKLGVSGNFFHLLRHADTEYIMFCDQDDIWLPDKIEITLNYMKACESAMGKHLPLLIHTDLKVVDQDARIISDSFWNYQHLAPQQGMQLNRLLVQNVVTGCTVMINRALKNKIQYMPKQALMHDWWIALAAAALGRIDYVPAATVLYRQHNKNNIGARKWGPGHVLKMASLGKTRLRTLIEKTQVQAAVFLDIFGNELTAQSREMLTVYSSMGQMNFFKKRICLVKYGFFKTGFLRNLGMLFSL
jgi:glycosyltransferase involved in cell wall biosynthesis